MVACRLGWVACVALIVGCGDDGSVGGEADTDTDTESAGTSSSSTTMVGTTEMVPEPICEPGEVECDGDDMLMTCSQDGLAWEPTACEAGFACVECAEDDPDCMEAACAGPCDPRVLEPSSMGCSFIASRQLSLTEVVGDNLGIPEPDWPVDGLVVINPDPDRAATVQVYTADDGDLEEVAAGDPVMLAPLETMVVDMPTPIPLGGMTTLRVGSLVRVESDIPVQAFTFAPYGPTIGNDSTMLLPESSAGLAYVVPSYPPHYVQFQGAGRPTYFDLIATTEDTTVRWLAQFARTGGNGVPIMPVEIGEWSEDIALDRFQGVRVAASSVSDPGDPHDADVSGTVIEATAPVLVVGGSRCSAVPASTAVAEGCDPLQEALIPVEQWGQTYVLAAPPTVSDTDPHIFRVYGGDQGVEVTATPAIPELPFTFSSRGEFVDIALENGTAVVLEGAGPIMPIGYLRSRGEMTQLGGDPAMYQHIAVEQHGMRYAITAPPDWTAQYLLFTRAAGAGAVMIDDAPVMGWEGVGMYETALVTIEAGQHILTGDAPFTATQFGFINDLLASCADLSNDGPCHASYAHPIGAQAAVLGGG